MSTKRHQVLTASGSAQDTSELSDPAQGTPQPSKTRPRAARDVRLRPRTLPGRVPRRTLDVIQADTAATHAEMGEREPRPNTWGECRERFGATAPCPYVSCRHHLALDPVSPREAGRDPGVKLNFPHLQVWEIPETCSLRAAEQWQGMTLESVAQHLNLTRERARQLEAVALGKLRPEFILHADNYDDSFDDGEELH